MLRRPLESWDDRSSARVQRVFALSQATSLATIARHADATLAAHGWYLVTPDDLDRFQNPQVIVWQREPDERLDLTQLWPISGMSRTQRLYGGIFPAEFLDAPLVIEWSWALDGPRSPASHAAPATRCPPSTTTITAAPLTRAKLWSRMPHSMNFSATAARSQQKLALYIN